MNRVDLTGRLTSKPELRTTSNNLSTTRFTLAVNRTFSNAQGEREADFITIVAWKNQAENVCKYLDKGSLVEIEGRIQTGTYDDKDGNKRHTTEVIADRVGFLSTKSEKKEEVKPSDFEPKKIENDPFADFGNSISIDDNFLD